MPSHKTIVSLLALASVAIAKPMPAKNASGKPAAPIPKQSDLNKIHWATAVSGALDLPDPTATPAPVAKFQAAADDGQMTITIINSHTANVVTGHTNPIPTAQPVSGNQDPGEMTPGQVDSFIVPRDWEGNVAFNEAGFAIQGDETLVEASYKEQGQGFPQSDINISMVNGFSVPIVCWCSPRQELFTGCNKNLFDLNQCPDDNGQHSCRNPLRPDLGATQPTDFFRPCFGTGGAYTFPMDSAANNLNQVCNENDFTCCVGTGCPANPQLG